MLQTMNEAYKVARLKGSYLPALRMFYLATLGAARSMHLEGTIGNFAPGAEADFIVLDPKSTPLLARRTAHCNTLEEHAVRAGAAGRRPRDPRHVRGGREGARAGCCERFAGRVPCALPLSTRAYR
jgi:cytosine/adenosine deaminase-related metal-dependent hydrolase